MAGQRAQAILKVSLRSPIPRRHSLTKPKPLIMRRTKDSMLEGQPILRLPPKDIELVKMEFTPDERQVGVFSLLATFDSVERNLDYGDGMLTLTHYVQIYDDIEQQTQVRINKYIAKGTLVKNYSFVLVRSPPFLNPSISLEANAPSRSSFSACGNSPVIRN